MESMTGFGRAEAAAGRLKVFAEARSVNNKGLEVKVRVPAEIAAFEPAARRLVRDRFSRGSVQVSLSLESGPGDNGLLDLKTARGLLSGLKSLKKSLKLPGTIDLEMVLRAAQASRTAPPAPDTKALTRAASKSLARALDDLGRSRRAEGTALAGDIAAHFKALAGAAAGIRRKSGPALAALKKSVAARARELAGGTPLDAERLEGEAAMLAARRDFTEEMNRLDAHFAAFRKVTGGRGPVGRELEFLTQEMLRELTTIASKAPGKEITALTIRARVELEKIREQVYNLA